MKEIFISHIYEKEGKEFNKEYYDLYWSSFLEKLVSIKKDNFVTYTGEEKKILEQND